MFLLSHETADKVTTRKARQKAYFNVYSYHKNNIDVIFNGYVLLLTVTQK